MDIEEIKEELLLYIETEGYLTGFYDESVVYNGSDEEIVELAEKLGII